MSGTTPIKAIQNGLRKHKKSASASEIREAATMLNLNIDSDSCIEPLIEHFSREKKPEPLSVLTNESDIDLEQLKSLPSVEPQNIITYQQKTEMVVSQASVLGVALSESDIAQIAKNVDYQACETDELLSEIRGAISAYIQYQKQANQVKIQTFLADINHEQNQANQEITEALSTGLQDFARGMEVSRQSFKSSVRNSLKLLAIPKQ